MKIDCLDARCYSHADAEAIHELRCRVWPEKLEDKKTDLDKVLNRWRSYSGPENQFPRSFVVRNGQTVIAHATFVPRLISTSQGEIAILGLASVCTDPDHRGQGLGEAVVRAALTLVDHGDFHHALFQTSAEVRGFYEKLGATVVKNTIVDSTAEDSAVCPFREPVVMRYPADSSWPDGQIDLRGSGF